MFLNFGWFFFFFFLLMPLLTGCGLPAQVQAGGSTVDIVGNDSSTKPNNAVCSPLGGAGSLGGNHGIQADLYYLDPSLPHFGHVSDYIGQGTKVNASLFFNQVNVPTRPFDDGFVTTTGTVLTTPEGNTLYEWFALDFRTTLKLTGGDLPGRVQFGLISDDGAVLSQQIGDNWVPVVDNDGTHASEFRGATAPIILDANSSLHLRLEYYQGPRFHIAAVLMWRPWTNDLDQNSTDPLDGQAGNGLYFDSTQTPSVPQQAYNDLLARGWKVVPPANFYLPDATVTNPCPPPTETATATATATATDTATSTATDTGVLAMQGFDGTTTADSANLIWQTTQPASGKIYWGLAADQLTNSVDEQNGAVTTHQVQLTGLSGATQYFFQAESSDSQNTVTSIVIHKTTK